MQRIGQDAGVIGKAAPIAIALVVVEIHDGDRLCKATFAQGLDRCCHIVVDAKAGAAIGLCVVKAAAEIESQTAFAANRPTSGLVGAACCATLRLQNRINIDARGVETKDAREIGRLRNAF